MNIWVPEWVPGFRNHPSIVDISIENEYGAGIFAYIMTGADIHNLAEAVRKYDWTRPLSADGDKDLGNIETVDHHYPEGYNASPSGCIYSWGGLLVATKPTGIGEFITSYGPSPNKYWQGTWCRGLRYLGFADIRPYTTTWSITGTGADAINLKNSFAPVALFDKAYDDLGVGPITSAQYPSVAAGSTANRTLILYNDEYRDTIVTIKAEIKSGTATLATGSKTYALRLGEHLDIPCSFQVPYVGGSTMDLVLTTTKAGVQRFTESKRFNVTGGTSGTSSSAVTLGGNAVAIVPISAIKRISQHGSFALYDLRGCRIVHPAGTIGPHHGSRPGAGVFFAKPEGVDTWAGSAMLVVK
jgi:hypothetical protein